MNPLTLVKRIQNINSKEADLGISEEASWHTKYKDSAYVFVGGIPFDLTEGDLLAVFSQYGEVVDVNLVRDKGTGKSKGFAFLAYEDQRSTILAVDNLNGAQILGRIVRVDHCSKYKKKEEEDEETERQKREARGVCHAFQRGECTRGAGCKFSHDERRAANTGWGVEDKSSRWGNDMYEGSKKSEKRLDNQEGFRSANKDLSSRAKGSQRALESQPKEIDGREGKRLKRHEDDEIAREDCDKRQERGAEDKSSRWGHDMYEGSKKSEKILDNQEGFRSANKDLSSRAKGSQRALESQPKEIDGREGKRLKRHDDDEIAREDCDKRQENRSKRYGDVKFEPKPRDDSDRREEKRSKRYEDDEFEPKSRVDPVGKEEKRLKQYDDYDHRREEKRSRRHDDGEYEPSSGRDHYRREEERPRRHGDDKFEQRSREDRDSREEKGSRRYELKSPLKGDRDKQAGDELSTRDRDSSSHYYGDRDDNRHKRGT